jgi:hypothetical protein
VSANRVLAVIGSMYAFASRTGIVAEGMNPARRIDQFKEHRRERFLTGRELERLGSAIREAETKGIPSDVDERKPKAKHLGLDRLGSYVVAGDNPERPRADLKQPWEAVARRLRQRA